MELAASPVTSRYNIQDWFSGWGGVLQLVLMDVGVECIDEKVSVGRVVFRAKCREPSMNS